MMAQCAQILKFLVPYTEKFSDPSYKMPDAALGQLQKMIQGLVKEFLDSPTNVRQEFRGIADDVESLRRLDDLIQKSRDGFVSADLKAEIMAVKKRLSSIKVILNTDLGKAPRKTSGCIFLLIILAAIAAGGWFFKDTIMNTIKSLLENPTNVQTTPDPDADPGDDADEEGDEVEVTKEPEKVSKPEPAAPEPEVKQKAEPETPETEALEETPAPEKAQADQKESPKPAKAGTYRVWTDINGKKLRARFIRMDSAGTIILEYKDKVAGVKQRAFAVGNFCEKDQQFIRDNYLE